MIQTLALTLALAIAVTLVPQGSLTVEAAQKVHAPGGHKIPGGEGASAQKYLAQQDSSAYLKKGKGMKGAKAKRGNGEAGTTHDFHKLRRKIEDGYNRE
jgi:hypothetical protein